MKSLDAKEVKCPALSQTIRQFMFRQIQSGEKAHVVTCEPRAVERIAHMCAQLGWSIVGQVQESNEFHFIILKTEA